MTRKLLTATALSLLLAATPLAGGGAAWAKGMGHGHAASGHAGHGGGHAGGHAGNAAGGSAHHGSGGGGRHGGGAAAVTAWTLRVRCWGCSPA